MCRSTDGTRGRADRSAAIDDRPQRVEVVQDDTGDAAHRGIDVTRHREVDEDDRPVGPADSITRAARARIDEDARRRRRGPDDVGMPQDVFEVGQRPDARRRGVRDRSCPRLAAIDDRQAAGVEAGDMAGDAAGRLARADDREVETGQRRAGPLDQLHRGRRHRDGAFGNRRLGPHACAGGQRRLEDAVQQRPGAATGLRALVRVAHLAEHLDVAEDEGLEPAGHAQQVPRRRRALEQEATRRRPSGRRRLATPAARLDTAWSAASAPVATT